MNTPERTITLRETRDEEGTRYLGARIMSTGDLVIEGQDLGSGVTKFFGQGITEYEYAWTIPREDVHLLLKALGGAKTHDILGVLKEQFSKEPALEVSGLLKEHHIKYEFWFRHGD